jgi:hypothetical protein
MILLRPSLPRHLLRGPVWHLQSDGHEMSQGDFTLEALEIFHLSFSKWRPSEVLPSGAREFGDQSCINSRLHQYDLRVRVILTL